MKILHGGNERLIKAKDNFIGFLKEELHIYEDHYCNVQLEDIFTPIDRCVWDGLSIGRYSARGWWNCGRSLTR